jgi:hypothetical protein
LGRNKIGFFEKTVNGYKRTILRPVGVLFSLNGRRL